MNNTVQLSNKAIVDFKKIYQKKFDVNLTDIEANEKGIELLEFFRLVYRPIPKNEYEYFKKVK